MSLPRSAVTFVCNTIHATFLPRTEADKAGNLHATRVARPVKGK